MAIDIAQDTSFTFDVLGRYGCNTLGEARDSADPQKQVDALPFHDIIIGGGSFGAVLATHLFNLDQTGSRRVLVLEAGPRCAMKSASLRFFQHASTSGMSFSGTR